MNSSKRNQQAMRAYLRIKPSEASILSTVDQNCVSLKGQGQFTYDHVFNQNSSNDEIFNQIGDPLIKHSLQGFNTSVLAYGQTASGKTFTMKGDHQNQGMIPRAIRKLFLSIQEDKLVAAITISYIQIYNENIIDLLSSSQKPLDIQENSMRNVTIINLTQAPVNSVEEAMKLFDEGQTRRKISSNNINTSSSRSHTIFRINVSVVNEDYQKAESCINMVDLAGSEGVSRTKAQGSTRKEGENINKSILALTNVFRGMSEKKSYVNFRDSKLTRILQSSFCSNSRSIVICTINPISQNYQQTVNTLKFGTYASDIKLAVKRNFRQNTQKTNKSMRGREIQSEYRNGFDQKENDDRLRPDERIQFEQNKRMISQLREDCREFRILAREKQKKVQFLQLQIHSLAIKLQNAEETLRNYQKAGKTLQNINIVDESERYHYQNQINNMKDQMNIMADRYDGLNEIYKKTLQNQRYLIDRIAKYQSEISLLKQSAENMENTDGKQQNKNDTNQNKADEDKKSSLNMFSNPKPKTPIKVNPSILYNPRKKKNIYSHHKNTNQQEQICPLTIGSIVKLKACIIELKRSLFEANEEIAKLTEQKSELKKQIQELQDQKCDQGGGKYNISHVEGKQIRNLNIRIRKLKNELAYHNNYEKKLQNKLKEKNFKGMEELDQFNEWYHNKVMLEQENRAKKRDQVLKSAGLIPQSYKKLSSNSKNRRSDGNQSSNKKRTNMFQQEKHQKLTNNQKYGEVSNNLTDNPMIRVLNERKNKMMDDDDESRSSINGSFGAKQLNKF